jgi:6-methylsalicylic acid synthase
MGVNSDDYGKLLLEDLPGVEYLMGIGTAYCGVPNRVSYLLDLQGPSTAVDAACASSLVAIHHGRMSLLCHETDVAIVGGVNAICAPGLTKVLDEAGAISAEGTCCSFDQSANGYGRGEGAAVIILKRLQDAVRDHDQVLAVIKGSAVGQDGRTNGNINHLHTFSIAMSNIGMLT